MSVNIYASQAAVSYNSTAIDALLKVLQENSHHIQLDTQNQVTMQLTINADYEKQRLLDILYPKHKQRRIVKLYPE